MDTALRKAAAVWVAVPGQRARLAWTAWRGGVLWLAAGSDQDVPGLTDGVSCTVTLRSPTTHSHLLDVAVTARLTEPDEETATALRGARLNGVAVLDAVYRLEFA
ncbi:hypothetical protein F0L68_08715 [Solihabitans fulvus]|uniref:Uncharacterized protein n=2 Tax=Solihabitans fulvus TaxID=1892852 RepID=A0A5B2XJS7_9PSEU|nr:hypothetical protein F0L68_08715 [Solihabitans fulvus]